MKAANDWAVSIMNNSGGNYKSISKCIQQAQAEAFAVALEAAAALVNEMRNENNVDLRQVRYLISAIPNPYIQPPTKEEA